jgi:hypothetical protein
MLDFGNTLTNFNQFPTAEQADRIALQQDWLAVGDDLRQALRSVDETQ